jgi:hypothetical protein
MTADAMHIRSISRASELRSPETLQINTTTSQTMPKSVCIGLHHNKLVKCWEECYSHEIDSYCHTTEPSTKYKQETNPKEPSVNQSGPIRNRLWFATFTDQCLHQMKLGTLRASERGDLDRATKILRSDKESTLWTTQSEGTRTPSPKAKQSETATPMPPSLLQVRQQ